MQKPPQSGLVLLLSVGLAASLLAHAVPLLEGDALTDVRHHAPAEGVTPRGPTQAAPTAAEREELAPATDPGPSLLRLRRPHLEREEALFASRPEAQASALCRVAKQKLREKWRTEKDDIVSSLGRSLADEPEQAKEAAKTSANMAEVLALDEADAIALAAEIATARAARVAAARAALEADPPDLVAVLDEAHELFEAEDDVAHTYAGAEGAAAWREHELESRTVVLALLASLADLEESEALAW